MRRWLKKIIVDLWCEAVEDGEQLNANWRGMQLPKKDKVTGMMIRFPRYMWEEDKHLCNDNLKRIRELESRVIKLEKYLKVVKVERYESKDA